MEAAEEFFALFGGAADSMGSTALGVHAPADSSRPEFWEGGGPPDAYLLRPVSLSASGRASRRRRRNPRRMNPREKR